MELPQKESAVVRLSLICGILAVLVLFWTLRSNPIYRSFKRYTSVIFSRKPIHEVVQIGHEEVKGREPFVVRWWGNDFVVMPPKYLKDIRGASWRHLSFFESISNSLHLEVSAGDLYTANSSQRMVDVIKRGLNPRIQTLTPLIVREIDYSFEKLLGSSTEWQEVKATTFFGEVAHRTVTRVLIGEELCRNEGFIKQSTDFLESIFVTALVIINLPLGRFRSFFAWPLSLLHRRRLRSCMDILRPVVRKRLKEYRGLHQAKNVDAIQWTLDLLPMDLESLDEDRVLKELLHNLWAASSAPGGMITEIVYQLLSHPEDIKHIREEAIKAMNQHGWCDKMDNSIVLQDSYIRETNRLFPTGSITCVRTVLDSPFRFSDGLTLPVGSRFGFPAMAIQREQTDIEDPLKFYGFRFARKCSTDTASDDSEKRWAASSVDVSNLPSVFPSIDKNNSWLITL
ncbi:cytochrome P450 [Daldinia decipiens]|uniref:cytochrome P450 n=1 Tax=Daldinia decipiens TaxID=326647 RepID=UPI0020C289F9|nr:cytochrome P450 [Daldinia decipiens]KAI1653942.1 cytochrome P450 [Daldinia decipiens]